MLHQKRLPTYHNCDLKGSVQWKNDFSSNHSLDIVKNNGMLDFVVVCFV